jgi:gliding motility-associated-like protein
MIELDIGEILMVVKAEHTGKTALIKMDNAFTHLWHKIIGSTSGDLYFWSGEFYNGEIFLAGNYDGNNGDVAVLNMTTDGTIKWAKAYGGEAEEQTIVKSKKSITCNSGSVFVIGSTEGFGVGMNDIYLIKADLNGTSGCNEIELSSTEGSLLYSPMVSDISINLVLQSSNLTVVPQGINDIEIVTLCPSGIVADFVSDVQIICVNDSVNFTDLSEPDSVSWNWQFEGGFPATSIVQNPQDIVYHNPGSFDVRLIVSDGINFDTLVKEDYIQVLPFAEIDLGDDQLFCDGDTLILDAGAGYDSYLWSNGDTSQAIRIIIPGMYWVSVTSEMECPGSDTINVVLLPDPEVSLGNDTLICFNEVLSLDAGAGFDSYLWQDGAQGQSLLVTEPGQYWVMVSNACGSGADTINVNFTEPYDISLGNDTSFCYGQSVVLDAGAGFEEYFWSTGDYTQTITATLGGNYWVQVTDAMGCSAVDSIYLDVFNDFEITIGSATQTICDGDYIFLNGPEGYQSYLWQDGSAGQSILADTAGVYWLEVTDENGCAARDSMELIVRVIAIFIGNDTILCEGSQVVLQTPPGFVSYHWHDGSTNPTFIATHEGIFWVEVTDELGCTGSDSVTVMLFEPPTLGMAHQEWMCPGDSLWLQADTGHLAYLWQDGTTTPEYLVTIPGLYQVQIETICGSYEDAVEIVLYSDNLNIGNDTTLCDGEIAVLWPGSGYTSHRWSTGATDSSIVVSSAGWYWLTAFDGFCNLTDSIRIDACADIRVPNVFTPNGDTYNDYFFAEPINPGGLTAFKMIIFNRWGRIVHELTHLDAQWDGKINGTDAAEGVYFWVCKYSAINKYGNVAERTKQGSVTLLR